jgi:1,4-alpha-glucan branching enzyme
VAEDGCLAFAATVSFDDGQAGQRVWWGVRLDGPAGANAWGIMTDDQQRQQELQLPGPGASAEAHYYLTWSRRLGAQKHYPGSAAPDLRFAVWAPNALNVEVLFATAAGYIADDEDGKDRNRPAVSLRRTTGGIWESDPVVDFAANVGGPYMFRIKNAQGQTTYRTDIYSRWQIGRVRWTQGRTWRASGPALVPECSASTKTSSGCAASTGPSAPARSISCTPPTPTASSPSPAGMGRPRCSLWRA